MKTGEGGGRRRKGGKEEEEEEQEQEDEEEEEENKQKEEKDDDDDNNYDQEEVVAVVVEKSKASKPSHYTHEVAYSTTCSNLMYNGSPNGSRENSAFVSVVCVWNSNGSPMAAPMEAPMEAEGTQQVGALLCTLKRI